MTQRYRSYTGSIDTVSSLLKSARLWLHMELCGLPQRAWTEDQAGELIKQHLPAIRADLADMQAFVREIEDTLTTCEEEQEAAKEVISRDAA